MSDKFSFEHLNATQFEEFCFDLLKSLSFENLSWRKGTGLSSSPSDSGRDIEGIITKIDIDGQTHLEKWFIECKHYKKGVPPEKLQGALAWANSAQPDILLIVVSNFLSNAAKKYIEDYRVNNNPKFRIKVWEIKDLEGLTEDKSKLRIKYKLSSETSFLTQANKYHLMYALKPCLNSVDFFLAVMDQLDPLHRDNVFNFAYFDLIKPRFNDPKTGDETLADLQIDKTDYFTFRNRCLIQSNDESPMFVQKIVVSTLAMAFKNADKTNLDEVLDTQYFMLDQIKESMMDSDDDEKSRLADFKEKIEQKF